MSWDNIFKLLASVGGIGAIVVAVIKFSSEIIADMIIKKYEAKLNKELEEHKTMLGKREYVSKIRFDTEFLIYRKLSRLFFSYLKAVCIMIPPGYSEQPTDPEARKKEDEEHYRKAHNAHVEAQDALYQNAPFIQKEFYEKYNKILKDGESQLFAYRKRYNKGYMAFRAEREEFEDKDYDRSQKMEKLMLELTDDIRQYLAKLDVVE